MNTPTAGRRERRVLTPTEVEKFQRQVSEDAQDRKETDQFFPGEDRAGVANSQLDPVKAQLKNNAPKKLTEYEKQAMEKRLKELKEYFLKNMVPKSGVMLRQQKGGVQDPDFRRASNLMASVEMSQQFQVFAQEWKNICRDLGRPEDANLEYLRPS